MAIFNKNVIGLLLLIVSLFWVASISVPPFEMENGSYMAYSRSLLAKGDLNTIDQFPSKITWMVSPTYNYPNYYDHGLTALWLPFVAFEKLLTQYDSADLRHLVSIKHPAFIAVTIFAFLLSMGILLQMLKTLAPSSSGRQRSSVLLILLFSTPLFWGVFLDPTNSELSSLLLSSMVCSYIVSQKELGKKDFFLLGAFLTYCLSAKIHFYFFLPLILIPLLPFFKKYGAQKTFQSLLSFTAGALPVFVLLFMNNLLKNGSIQSPYGWFFKTSSFFIPGISLFYPGGGFQTTLLLVILWGIHPMVLLYLYIKKKYINNALFLLLGLLIPLIHLVFFCLRFGMSQSYYPGTKHLIVFTPFFALALLHFVSLIKTRTQKAFLSILVIASIVWTIYQSSVIFFTARRFTVPLHLFEFDWPLAKRVAEIVWYNGKYCFDHLSAFLLMTALFIPLFWAMAIVIEFLFKHVRNNDVMPFLKKGMVALVLCYVLISLSNQFFNQKNVQKMKQQGVFASKVVSTGPLSFFYDDIIDIIDLSNFYYARFHEDKMLAEIQVWKKDYLDLILKEIVVDPIHFKDDLMNDKIRPSIWNEE